MNRANPFASKRDANAPAIDAALVAAGASVQPLDMVGGGCPDRIVGYRGLTVLMEYKSHNTNAWTAKGKTYSYRRANSLKPSQKEWIAAWRGQPVVIVYSPEEALAAIGCIK